MLQRSLGSVEDKPTRRSRILLGRAAAICVSQAKPVPRLKTLAGFEQKSCIMHVILTCFIMGPGESVLLARFSHMPLGQIHCCVAQVSATPETAVEWQPLMDRANGPPRGSSTPSRTRHECPARYLYQTAQHLHHTNNRGCACYQTPPHHTGSVRSGWATTRATFPLLS